MSEVLLNVQNVGKCYSTYRSNLQRFARWFGAPVPAQAEFWAARHITFSLSRGESVALIGQNGAGKSTILKLITGTVRQTEGTIGMNGRISAILELGLGFNPEFSGRTNVLHSGGLLGHSPEQMQAMLPEIEAFAEIGEHFDQPLRTYSSGMQARVAFALATAMRPDVLIVDEVLSVGDSYFQHKSFNRIRQFRKEGTTIVLVTHSMADVRTLCDRCILIDKGRVAKDGAPDEVIDYYNAMIAEKENAKLSIEQRRSKGGWSWTRSGTFDAVVATARLIDAATGKDVYLAQVRQKIRLVVEVNVNADLPGLVLGILVRDRTGHIVWGTNTHHTGQQVEMARSGERIEFDVDIDCDLGPGSYSITYALTDSETHMSANYEWVDNAIVFDVVNLTGDYFVGTSRLNASFTVKRDDDDENSSRVAMTTSCRDCDGIEKHQRAGQTIVEDGAAYQVMHNGLKVVSGGYYGSWMAKIIEQLKGHHEPQEEYLFHSLVEKARPGTLFVELGSYWAYYSMWYLKEVKGSTALCIEPDPVNVAVGKENARLNGLSDRMRFFEAWIGGEPKTGHSALVESSLQPRELPMLDMRGILDLTDGRPIEVLHADIQGGELDLVRSMGDAAHDGSVRFVFLSTHHKSISGSATTHEDVVDELKKIGATIYADFKVEESFAGDGLIVAGLLPEDRDVVLPKISRNKRETSLFPEG